MLHLRQASPIGLFVVLAASPHVGAQGVLTEVRCLRLSYDSAQHGASAGLFPAFVTLLPGRERGDLRIADTTRFLYYRPDVGVASWLSRTGAIWSFMIEWDASGVSYTLHPVGDLLVGSATYHTDAWRPDEPTMRVIATRVSCAGRL